MKNNRYNESIAPIIHNEKDKSFNYKTKILLSPSDQGVVRNNGRNGSRFAPKAIINLLRKQNNHLVYNKNEAIFVTKVFHDQKTDANFSELQTESSKLILDELNENNLENIIHLGGGHDHIYPLLMALDNSGKYKNILIINVDAHCDTRVDSKSHSGTPFRDFDKSGKTPFHIVQYGIHDHANSESTLSSLDRGSEKKIFYKELIQMTNAQTKLSNEMLSGCPFDINKDTAVILSLDCDGIDGSQMQAVSSVNTLGVSLQHILELIKKLKALSNNQMIFGIYEFNPVYDNPSLYGCKSVVHLIYEFLRK